MNVSQEKAKCTSSLFESKMHVQPICKKLGVVLIGTISRIWMTIIKHVKEFVLDDKLYICGADGIGLLFDSVLIVKGATFDGQNYLPIEKFSIYQMVYIYFISYFHMDFHIEFSSK